MEGFLKEKMWLKTFHYKGLNKHFREACIYTVKVKNIPPPLTHVYPSQNTSIVAYLIRVSIFP